MCVVGSSVWFYMAWDLSPLIPIPGIISLLPCCQLRCESLIPSGVGDGEGLGFVVVGSWWCDLVILW